MTITNATCWYCGGPLCWDSDFDYADVHGEDTGIVTFLHCGACGAEVEYSLKEEEYRELAKVFKLEYGSRENAVLKRQLNRLENK